MPIWSCPSQPTDAQQSRSPPLLEAYHHAVRFEFENTRPEMSDEEILADLKRVASALNTDTLSRDTYQQHGSYAPTTVKKRFGSWNRALAAAGLRIVRVRNLPDETLIDNLREVWIKLGRQPRKV